MCYQRFILPGHYKTIIIDLCKMMSWARYNCMLGQIWPAGLEFDTYALENRRNITFSNIKFCFTHIKCFLKMLCSVAIREHSF